MMWCYLDDSGTDGQSPTVTMAGYIASMTAWKTFERETRKLFRGYRIDHFHAKEFHDGNPPFAGWSLVKQVRFVDEWFSIARQTNIQAGITLCMGNKRFVEYKKETKKWPTRSTYGHCFDNLVDFLLSDDAVGSEIIDRGVSFFVEAGTKGNQGVLDIFNRRRATGEAAFLHQLGFIDKESCKAIQLADFLAFYSRRHSSLYVAEAADKRIPALLDHAKDKVRVIAQLAEDFIELPRHPVEKS